MFRRKRNIQNDTAFLLAGAAVGGILALLYAPKKGEELRNDIKKEVNSAVDQVRQKAETMRQNAQVTANGMINRAGEILNLSREYVEGGYGSTASAIQHEISSLRRAFNSAIETYRNYKEEPLSPPRRRIDNVFTTVDFEYNDETLPKVEGMGRRQE